MKKLRQCHTMCSMVTYQFTVLLKFTYITHADQRKLLLDYAF